MNGNTMDLSGAPMSVEEISDRANEFFWNPTIPLKYWLRAADTIIAESEVYLQEGNYSQAYMLLMRYSTLVLNHLPSHPDSKNPEHRQALKTCRKRVPAVMDKMEAIKPELKSAYEEWSKIQAAQRDHSSARQGPLSRRDSFAERDPALSWNAYARADILDAGQHQDLAVDLASKEIRRRRRQAGLSEEEEQKRRTAGVWDDWEAGALDEADTANDLQAQMQAARWQLDEGHKAVPSTPQPPGSRSSMTYRYPSIERTTPFTYDTSPSGLRREPTAMQPPRPPRKEPLGLIEPLHVPRQEISYSSITPPPLYEGTIAPALPPKTTETPQSKVTFRPAAYLENGEPLRPVFLPTDLRKTFLELASSNTRRGVEMCGILCGTLVNNALFISCLLIPEQRCTPDTCETENEAGMLEYCMSKDLLLIGWIHTHPTQTCFMSSRDLHTHAGYQVMMPESIAIVCAPRHTPSWGIFRLTKGPGLQHILACRHADTFHQHNIDNIYTDAGNPPGHVFETDKLEFVVKDLRP